MKLAKLDEKGRILLGRKVAQQYGEKFVVLQSPHELVLVPVPDDPTTALQKMGKGKVDFLTLQEMRKLIQQQAEEELG